MIAYLEKKIAEHKPLTDEDVKKIRRRQKAEGIISGIADAAQSVANLFYTTQYAPNMYNADEGMSARAKARFEKEKAEREADDDRYFNYAMNLAKLKEADQQKGSTYGSLSRILRVRIVHTKMDAKTVMMIRLSVKKNLTNMSVSGRPGLTETANGKMKNLDAGIYNSRKVLVSSM